MSGNMGFKLAILVPDEDSKSIAVRYKSIPCFAEPGSAKDCVITFDELPQSYAVAGERGDGPKKKVPLDAPSKGFSLSHTATYDAVCFLSNNSPRLQSQKKNGTTKKEAAGDATVAIGRAALILSRDSSSNSTFRSPQYHAVTFSFPRKNATDIQEILYKQNYDQLLMIRQPGLQRSSSMSLTKDLGCFDDFDVVEVCTGMCLFSEQDLALCAEDGVIFPARLKALRISLSEMEIITRLATTISNTCALYHYNCGTKHGKLLRVNIDIPSVQYYQNALDSYSNSQCTVADVLDWMGALTSRRCRLFDVFVKAVRHSLKERHVPESSVVFQLSSGLDGAAEGVFCALKFCHPTCDWIDLIMQSALRDGKEQWPEFMNTLTEMEQRPTTWREFNTLSYMYEVTKPVLRARSIHSLQAEQDNKPTHTDPWRGALAQAAVSAPQSPTRSCSKPTDFFETGTKLQIPSQRILLLAIDDVDERRIYTKAYHSLCRLSTTAARSPGAGPFRPVLVTTRILTICPAPQVVVGTSGLDPKWTRPSLWRSLLRSERSCDQLRFLTQSNLPESDVQVLKQVYNADLVARIEGWIGQGSE